jgi:mercuric ion transport protein
MKDKAFIGASLIAGIAASLCCILPIVFAVAGAGIVGASAFFAAWRPYLLGITFLLLAVGFYFAYRKPKEACEPGSACAVPSVNRKGRIGLWIATGFVILFAAFPYYSGPVANLVLQIGSSQSAPPTGPQLAHVTLAVEGMDCTACATAIENRLSGLAGVRKASVSYEQKKAEVDFDESVVTVAALEKAIADSGYKSHPVPSSVASIATP